METKALTAQVPLQLAERIDLMAAQLDRPQGWIVKQALTDWVEREEQQHQMVLEALADVDAGRLISDADVQAWVDSLDSPHPRPAPRSSAR